MQNGGLASGIAIEMGRVSSLGLAVQFSALDERFWFGPSDVVEGRDPDLSKNPRLFPHFRINKKVQL